MEDFKTGVSFRRDGARLMAFRHDSPSLRASSWSINLSSGFLLRLPRLQIQLYPVAVGSLFVQRSVSTVHRFWAAASLRESTGIILLGYLI